MPDTVQVFAGDCTVRFEDGDVREERGAVVVVAKPDDTVLVHGRDGYRPAAWLTRADAVSYARDPDGFTLDAVDGGRRLHVDCHEGYGHASYPASRVGDDVGPCPDCPGTLVHAGGSVSCLSCGTGYGLPRDVTVLEERCGNCGLPRVRVDRGATFEVCVDRSCESLDDRVARCFDRAWDCPACGGDLLILRRGGLIAGCERYPDCEAGFSLPAGTVDGPCPECGLPVFEAGDGRRCLDATCPGPS